MRVCIVGLGLLGGSVGLSLKNLEEDIYITGVDTNEDHARLALERGIVDELSTFRHGVSESDVVVLATPVNAIVQQIGPALDLLRDDAVLIDLGSTKAQICSAADQNSRRNRFIASHPIAGTEDSGPKAAFASLLPGKMMIVCDKELSAADALEKALSLFSKLSMKVEYMPSIAHDIHIAYVSHLSHISSFALGATVLEKEKNEQNIFIMAGSGFSSTVRLAKSSPDMWTPIFSQNKVHISEAIGKYIQNLQSFKDMLDSGNEEAMHTFMKDTNDIRRVLKGD